MLCAVMKIVGVVAFACIAACMSPVMKFGDGKSAKQAQHDTMASFGPARLATEKTWNGEVTTKKLRVWADNEYRTQNRDWQRTFEEPLELANVVITPILGLRLVAEYAVWERHEPGATLDDHITALMEHDPGSDVFGVVGLTSSLPLVSSTFEQLGVASMGGRHIVLRGYADLEERTMYANAFPDLRADERELALVHLRHHKMAVILLHELGHNFGAGHEGVLLEPRDVVLRPGADHDAAHDRSPARPRADCPRRSAAHRGGRRTARTARTARRAPRGDRDPRDEGRSHDRRR